MRPNKLALLMLCLCSPLVPACEPAAFDFDRFLTFNDHNKDGYLNLSELIHADMTQDYGNDLVLAINTKEAFDLLDTNNDHRLSATELWAWGRYTHNTCSNMPLP